jgi:hypothetical protein
MDDMMMQSLRLSRDLIMATIEENEVTTEAQMKLMGLWHQISKVIGYPEHEGL